MPRGVLSVSSVLKWPESLYEMAPADGYGAVTNLQGSRGVTVLTGPALSFFDAYRAGAKAIGAVAQECSISEEIALQLAWGFADEALLEVQGSAAVLESKERRDCPKQASVWFHTTNRCNLACVYCYVCGKSGDMSPETAELAIRKVVQSAVATGYTKLAFKFSGGEATLRMPFLRLVARRAREEARLAGLDPELVLLTNGTLITPQIAAYLSREDFRVSVSMDGVEKCHDRTRIYPDGGGSHANVLRGLRLLREVGIDPTVLIVLSEGNIKGVTEFAQFCLAEDLRFVFTFVREPLRSAAWDQRVALFRRELGRCYSMMAAHVRSYGPCRHSIETVHLNRASNLFCGAGRASLVVDYDGTLAPCQTLMRRVTAGSVADADNVFDCLRTASFLPKNSTPAVCQDCMWLGKCGSGCPALRYINYGGLSEKSPYCRLYQLVLEKLVLLEALGKIRGIEG